MIDEFIYKYRLLIGGVLIFIILSGSGLLIWDKINRGAKEKENQIIAELRAQNDLLRNELSNQTNKNIAGVSDQSDKININTASAEELDKLPGIGPARATDIISYRESHGDFQTIEEIKNIKGVGDKTFENMKDLITVGETSEEFTDEENVNNE